MDELEYGESVKLMDSFSKLVRSYHFNPFTGIEHSKALMKEIRNAIDRCIGQPPTSEPPSEPGWISVEDRLPEMKGGTGISSDVLCFKVCDGACGLKYHIWIALFIKGGNVSPNPFGFPTHWMKLPQSPIKKPPESGS